MISRKILSSNLLLLLFIICPIFALPFAINMVFNKKKWAVFILSLFMGLCAILWPPTGDLYRHSISYFEYRQMTLPCFVNELKMHPDFIFHILSFVFAKIGLNFEILRFLFVFICYNIIFYIFYDSVKCKKIGYHNLIFTCFYFSVMFFSIVQGLRFATAVYIFIYGSYIYLINTNNKGLIYLILSFLIHFSIFPLSVLVILIKVGLNINRTSMFILFFVILFLANDVVLKFILNLLPISDIFRLRLESYLFGYWNVEFLEDHSFKYLLSRYLSHLAMYPLLLYVLITDHDSKYATLNRLLFLLICVSFLISKTLYFRLSILVVPVALIYFCRNCNFGVKSIYLLLLCLFIGFSSQIYTFRREFSLSREYKLIFPVPYVLINSFEYQWIIDNVYSDGEGKNLKY